MRASKISCVITSKLQLIFGERWRWCDEEVVIGRLYSRLTHIIAHVIVIEKAVVAIVSLAEKFGVHKLFADEKSVRQSIGNMLEFTLPRPFADRCIRTCSNKVSRARVFQLDRMPRHSILIVAVVPVDPGLMIAAI